MNEKKYCCEFMNHQMNTECPQHKDQTCPDQVIRKFTQGYGIPLIHDSSNDCMPRIQYYSIDFCPACGKKLENSYKEEE